MIKEDGENTFLFNSFELFGESQTFSLNLEEERIGDITLFPFANCFEKIDLYENIYDINSIINIPKDLPKNTPLKDSGKSTDKSTINPKNIFKVLNRKREKILRDDNISLMISVDYCNFIPNFVNFLLKIFNFKEENEFCKIDANLKKNITKKKHSIILNQKIKYLLSSKISNKYKRFDSKNNETLCERIIKEIPIMEKILDIDYLTFFQKVYFPSKREINLKDLYGIEKTIYLPKNIKMFKDKFSQFDEESKERIYNVVNEKYFGGKMQFLSINMNN